MNRRLLIIPSLLLLAFLALVYPAQGQTDNIIVNGADATTIASFLPSPDLNALIDNIGSRFVIEYANSNHYYNLLEISDDLNALLDQVGDRFVIQYANSNRLYAPVYPVDLVGDNTAPQLDDLFVSPLGGGEVKLSWTTDEFAKHTLEYGTQPGSYPNDVTTNLFYYVHEVTLTDLTLNSAYYYRISNTDRSGNTFQSPEYSFAIQPFIYLPLITR